MIDVDEFRAEYAEVNLVARLHSHHRSVTEQFVLGEFILKDAERQLCPVDGYVDHLEKVRDRSYMVLMTVGDEDTLYFIRVFFEIREVRYDEVDTGHILFGKRDPAVNDDDIRAVFEDGDVLSYLVESSEHHDPELGMRFLCHCFPFCFFCSMIYYESGTYMY